MDPSRFPLNAPFRPSPKFRLRYAVVALLAVLLDVGVYAPIALFTDVPFLVTSSVAALIAVVLVLFLVWTLLYYASMEYELGDDQPSGRGVVWFRRTGIVLYSRITNIDVRQGPVMRAPGISNLALQTAGSTGRVRAEIVLEAMEHTEGLRAALRARVRGAAGRDVPGFGSGRGPGGPIAGPEVPPGPRIGVVPIRVR